MDRIRVIIADDSALARALIRDFLEGDDQITVVAEAENGRQAVEMVHGHHPDLVTMDLEMPVMNGLEAIEEIMATHPVPILVVSGVSDAQKAYAAVSRGALEVIDKPDTHEDSRTEFVAKVKMLATVKVITHLRTRRTLPSIAPTAPPPRQFTGRADSPVSATAFDRENPLGNGNRLNGRKLFTIASSTGGPQVLASILSRLPADFPCPIVIAQHISEGFAQGLSNWLDSISKIEVRLAQESDPLLPGVAYISPSESHLIVVPGQRLSLRLREPGEIYRPSCDILLISAAAVFGANTVGLILTGMGNDGAAGMERIHQAGGVTLAQDEQSSIIYGMNRLAIERGVVQRILAADHIPAEMIALTGQTGRLSFRDGDA
ncbi:Protein-glutamate methylesterase/protein-glutamine glutaminase 3 [uncultured Gammaproteobacteria bacterium]